MRTGPLAVGLMTLREVVDPSSYVNSDYRVLRSAEMVPDHSGHQSALCHSHEKGPFGQFSTKKNED